MTPHRRRCDDWSSWVFRTITHGLSGRLLNLSRSGRENGANFYHFKKKSLKQKCLHQTPTSHLEVSFMWRTSTVALERAARSRATPGNNPCSLHSSDEMHLAGKIVINKTCNCRSASPAFTAIGDQTGLHIIPGQTVFSKKMESFDTPFFS